MQLNGKAVPILLSALWVAVLAAGGLWVNNLNEDVRRMARVVDANGPRYDELLRRSESIESSQRRLSEKLEAFTTQYYQDRLADRRHR